MTSNCPAGIDEKLWLKKLPSGSAIQSDGSFLGRSSRLGNYRQKHRQKFPPARPASSNSRDITKNQ
jgi:hypothetical protein